MQWSELYDKEHEPQEAHIRNFIDTPLWDNLTGSLKEIYNVKPKLFYSCCSMQNGFLRGGT